MSTERDESGAGIPAPKITRNYVENAIDHWIQVAILRLGLDDEEVQEIVDGSVQWAMDERRAIEETRDAQQ